MSTRLDLSKEVEKLLNKARSLNLHNESYYQSSATSVKPSPISTISSSSSVMQNLFSSVMMDSDYVNNLDDIEFVNIDAINLSNDETWLSEQKYDSNKSVDEILDWLRQDIEPLKKDERCRARNTLMQYEINRLSPKINNNTFLANNNNIDSRTFTRPKKKMTRPSLESINSTFKYIYKNPYCESAEDDYNMLTTNPSDLKISLLKSEIEMRKKDADLLKSSASCSNSSSSESMKSLKDTTSLELSNSLEDVIRGQMKKVDVNNSYRFNLKSVIPNEAYESVQNASPPPSLMVNSAASLSTFGSNFQTSLTESDFITTVNQPQDLYTSYTSTVAGDDLNEDQTFTVENEQFANDVKNLHDTFTRNIEEDNLNETVIKVGDLSTASSSSSSFKSSKNSLENLTFTANKHESNFLKDNNLTKIIIERPANNVTQIIETKSETKLNKTNILSKRKDLKQSDNTFVRLHNSANNKISLSDPNLIDQCDDESMIEEENLVLNRTFSHSKSSDRTNHSSDSLNISDSSIATNSSRALNDFAVPNQKYKLPSSTIYKSTPIRKSYLVRKSWANSVELLSPISSSPLTIRESQPILVDNIQKDKNEKNLSSAAHQNETKILNLIESNQEPNHQRQLFKELNKTKDIYDSVDSVNNLKEQIPTMIVKPLEIKRPSLPLSLSPQPPSIPVHKTVDTNKLSSNVINTTQVLTTTTKSSSSTESVTTSTAQMPQLRQPSVRSGLPRPTSTSSIPRPQSRLPIPRSIKPPQRSQISKPTTGGIPPKNNWRDGCY